MAISVSQLSRTTFATAILTATYIGAQADQSTGTQSNSKSYYVHEWGTFTTVSGSDGKLLTGLQREEEILPGFVHNLGGIGHGSAEFQLGNRFRSKGNIVPVKNVTVKMETPVIYFYGEPQEHVNIKVGFNGGSISQWYPERTKGEIAPTLPPFPEALLKATDFQSKVYQEEFKKWDEKLLSTFVDFGDRYQGSIEWDAEILPRSAVDPVMYFKPQESKSWIYPAVPDSNIVKVGKTYEQYLFYRGIGNFTLPVSFSVDASETLKIDNHTNEQIPFAFVFEKQENGDTRYTSLTHGVPANTHLDIKEADMTTLSSADRVETVFKEMRKGLIAQGLTRHEANGMIKTWWSSYFAHPGLRVFWIVPTNETERILPLQITPAPESTTRVIVGRSEVMRPRFEKKLIGMSKKEYMQNYSSDRFSLAYNERLKTLRKVKTKE